MAKKTKQDKKKEKKKLNPLVILLPGLLVAATGVGAGDLATGALVGSRLGMAVLWVVLLGAGMKFLLNEGLARWQLATGTTLLEGCVSRLGRAVGWFFLIYLLIWSFFVASALMNACGVVAHAIHPCYDDAAKDKIFLGLMHSAAAVALILRGGYRTFERVMAFFVAVMFVIVVATALSAMPSWSEFFQGLVWPTIPDFGGRGIGLTVALMGGVGGTVTILCYGYWIREEGRRGTGDLRNCRIDLAVAYAMTAAFGLSVIVIGSRVDLPETAKAGADLFEKLGDELGRELGLGARSAFLFGAWAAIFSSMLGVWQSVPYLFTDLVQLMFSAESRRKIAKRPVNTRSAPYRGYLVGMAVIPAVGLWMSFEKAQIYYAVVGAMFIPMLAAVLLALNGRSGPLADEYRNSRRTTALLIGVLVFFLVFGGFKLLKVIQPG